MHTTSFLRRSWLLTLAALGLGCSSTGGFGRGANDPSIKTIASIGDRPITAVAGVPTSSAVADLEDHASPRDRDGRVSGRVVDDRGEPVPKARVRIADGGISGGRITEAISDRAGGFTLHGLRPGSKYTLIAEYEEQGGWVEGRAEVRSPATGVEIAVQADAPADRRRAARPPGGRTVSERRSNSDDEGTSSRVNEDDVPQGSDVEDVDDLAGPAPTTKRSAAVTVSGSGWRPSRGAPGGSKMASSALDDRATRRASTRPATESGDEDSDEPSPRSVRRDDDEPSPLEEDDANPLPPAIERNAKRDRGGGPGRDPDPSADRPRSTRRVSQSAPERPGPTPGALALANDVTPASRTPDRVSRSEPDPTPPASAVEADAFPEVAPVEDAAYDPFPAPKKPSTWADLSAAWNDERPARDAIAADTVDFEPTAMPGPDRKADPVADRPRAASRLAVGGGSIEACRFDAKRLQVLDLRLPDLDGRPVSLSDFDADFVLLDFWGTWCRPCLTSVPHLVELQERLGGRSLAIVGIACEEGPASASAAHVADVAKRLGINYTVLVSSKDDAASPVQEALHIQAFPTMVLVDRNGRVVWRDQGATTTTLARLDRVLNTSTRAAGESTARR